MMQHGRAKEWPGNFRNKNRVGIALDRQSMYTEEDDGVNDATIRAVLNAQS
jgi:hypothetical protein